MTLHTGKAYRKDGVSIEAPNPKEIRAAVISDEILEEVEAGLAWALRDPNVYYFSIKYQDKLVGQIYLHDIDWGSAEGMIGYHLFRKMYHGRRIEPGWVAPGKGTGKLNIIENILGEIEGGSVLDVATQEGHFVQILMKYLKSYTEIMGVDTDQGAIKSAQNTLVSADVKFQVMDAERLNFENARFDTVSISASLHHLSNIPRVLSEMVRVLKPGGHFVIVEMHRDGQTETALTSVYLHEWVAEVDTALGNLHNRTLARQEFKNHVADLGLRNIAFHYDNDGDSDPKEGNRIEQLDDLIKRTIKRAENSTNDTKLKERGEQLRQRLHKIGAQREPIILIVGVN